MVLRGGTTGFRAAAVGLLLVGVVGCGTGSRQRLGSVANRATGLPADYVPIRAGVGARYRLPARGELVSAGRALGPLHCTRRHPAPFAVHLELYARGLVVPVPAGIGVTPPLRRHGAYVVGGACLYPARSLEPTGLILVDGGVRVRLAELFALWGQPLGRGRLASFHGPVKAYVDGRSWDGPPQTIPLIHHAEIVLESVGSVIPHRSYRFPPGL